MRTYNASLKVTLRKGILDVQGKAVEHALQSMNFNTMNNIRIGKYIELNVDAESEEQAKSLIDDAAKQLLTNPIIEDYELIIK